MASAFRIVCLTTRAVAHSTEIGFSRSLALRGFLRNDAFIAKRLPRRRPLVYLGLFGFGAAGGVASHQAMASNSGDQAEFLPSVSIRAARTGTVD